MLALGTFNPHITVCFVAPYPFGCEYDADLDCERGLEYSDNHFLLAILIFFLILVPVTIIGSMVMIHRHVADTFRFNLFGL